MFSAKAGSNGGFGKDSPYGRSPRDVSGRVIYTIYSTFIYKSMRYKLGGNLTCAEVMWSIQETWIGHVTVRVHPGTEPGDRRTGVDPRDRIPL